MDDSSIVFQSRLRAKKEERVLRQQEQASNVYLSKDIGAVMHVNVHRPIAVDSTDDAMKRRERADARKRVIDYQGTVWDAVSANDLDMVRNYLLVEGAQTLLRRRHPDVEQGGRTLLHCSAWLGYGAIVELILTTGCNVDVVDSVASNTTALAEAARAGHSNVCITLLRHGASPRHRDSHGDTPFHWAGRQGHGTVLLQMALEQERLEPGSTPAIWVMKNYKGRSVIDLIQANTFIVPLLQKRLGNSFTRALESAKGKRRSRFPVRAAVDGARKSILIRGNSRPVLNENGIQESDPLESVQTTLSGVNELGLDISSFSTSTSIMVPTRIASSSHPPNLPRGVRPLSSNSSF